MNDDYFTALLYRDKHVDGIITYDNLIAAHNEAVVCLLDSEDEADEENDHLAYISKPLIWS